MSEHVVPAHYKDDLRALQVKHEALVGAMREAATALDGAHCPGASDTLRALLPASVPEKEEKVSGPVSAYVERYNAMDKELAALKEALQWCGAASDFQEDGFARKGWLKVAALLDPPKKERLGVEGAALRCAEESVRLTERPVHDGTRMVLVPEVLFEQLEQELGLDPQKEETMDDELAVLKECCVNKNDALIERDKELFTLKEAAQAMRDGTSSESRREAGEILFALVDPPKEDKVSSTTETLTSKVSQKFVEKDILDKVVDQRDECRRELGFLKPELAALKDAARAYVKNPNAAEFDIFRALLDPPKKPGLREPDASGVDWRALSASLCHKGMTLQETHMIQEEARCVLEENP